MGAGISGGAEISRGVGISKGAEISTDLGISAVGTWTRTFAGVLKSDGAGTFSLIPARGWALARGSVEVAWDEPVVCCCQIHFQVPEQLGLLSLIA